MLQVYQGRVCVTVNIKAVLAGPACEELHLLLCAMKTLCCICLSVGHKPPSPSNSLTEEKLFQYQFWNWHYPDQTPPDLHCSLCQLVYFYTFKTNICLA